MQGHAATILFCAAVLATAPGCLASRLELNSALAQNRALTEQNRALTTEIANLRAHNRDVEDRLIRNDEQLVHWQDRTNIASQQVAGYENERAELYQQFQAVAVGRVRVPPELSRQFADLSRRYPDLQFDPATGVSKLDTSILFDSGATRLRPNAGSLLDAFARVMQSPEAAELKILVVGHTDNRQIAGQPTREKYPNNFHLSAARALAVADRLRQAGLPQERIAVAGLGANGPQASNLTVQDRQQNRRVEIYVMASDVPLLGCVDAAPRVY